jgi:mRNA interferase MazF
VRKSGPRSEGTRSQDTKAIKREKAKAVLNRGDVWLVVLDPTIGSEIQKTRPCLIISPSEMHNYLRTVMVAPMTMGSHPAPFRVPVVFNDKDALILLDQIRTIDKQRLVRCFGSVNRNTLKIVLQRLRDAFEE